jgi:hypothetical protein
MQQGRRTDIEPGSVFGTFGIHSRVLVNTHGVADGYVLLKHESLF